MAVDGLSRVDSHGGWDLEVVSVVVTPQNLMVD